MSLKAKATSGLFWTLLQQFGYQGINFVVQLLLARILLPEAFGIIALLQVFISVSNNLIDSGMASSLIRNKDLDERDYSTVFYLNIGVAVFLYGVMFVSSPFIANFYNIPILTDVVKIYCLSFVINAFSIIQVTKLTKEMRFKRQMFIQLPSLVISGIVSVYLAYSGWGVWSIVTYNLLLNLLTSLQYWLRSTWRPKFIFDMKKLKYHFNFGYKLSLASLLNSVFDNIYGVVIGKVFSPQTLGYYNRAEMFQLFPSRNISTALEKVTYPMFAQIQDDNEKLKKYYRQIFNMVVFFLTPTMVFLSVIAEPLFRFLLTEKWLPMVPYFQILTIVGVLHPFQRYNVNILRVKGRSDLVLKLNIIRKLVLIITIVIGIRYGIYGILISQCVYSVICVFLNTMYSAAMINYPLKEQVKDVAGIYILAILIGFGIYQLDKIVVAALPDILRIVFGMTVGYVGYFGVAYLFKFEIISIISKFINERKNNGKK